MDEMTLNIHFINEIGSFVFLFCGAFATGILVLILFSLGRMIIYMKSIDKSVYEFLLMQQTEEKEKQQV